MESKIQMEYRYLGNTSLRVSAISFGDMVNHMVEDPQASTNEIVKKCIENGISRTSVQGSEREKRRHRCFH